VIQSQEIEEYRLDQFKNLTNYQKDRLKKMLYKMNQARSGQRGLPDLADTAVLAITQSIEKILENTDGSSRDEIKAPFRKIDDQDVEGALLERLVFELEKVKSLRGIHCSRLSMNANEGVTVIIGMGEYELVVLCDKTYRLLGPRRARVWKGEQLCGELDQFVWGQGKALIDVVKIIAWKMASGTFQS
jgi:hypothetical protein